MNNIKIKPEPLGRLAYTIVNNHNTIYLDISPHLVFSLETIGLYYSFSKKVIKSKLLNFILSLLEHETLHIVLSKNIGVEATIKLDNPIKGLTLEYRRAKEYSKIEV